MLLAQGSADIAAWGALASAVTQLGFSVFIALWYIVKKEPADRAEARKAILEERQMWKEREERRDADSKLRMEAFIQDSKDKLKLLADENRENVKRVLEHCERETSRRDDIVKTELAVVGQTMVDAGHVMEQVRERLIADKSERDEQVRAKGRRGGQ